MSSWKYTTNDVSDPAFMPVPNLSKLGSSHGLVKIFGQPGTMAVASPKPEALRPPCQGEVRPSMASPDVIFPCIYIPYVDNMQPNVPRVSTHEVPIPAKKDYVIPRATPYNPGFGGPFAMQWPAAPQQYTSDDQGGL